MAKNKVDLNTVAIDMLELCLVALKEGRTFDADYYRLQLANLLELAVLDAQVLEMENNK